MSVENGSQNMSPLDRPALSARQLRAIGRVAQRFEKRAMEGFGARLRKARDKVGLSQDDVAEILGCKRNAVATWEAGKFAPQNASTKRFAPLARRLKVSVEWLLYGVDISPDAGTDPRIERIREVVREFGRRYASLSEVLEILNKAAESDSAAASVRDDVLALRKVYRDLEDLLDA